MWQFLRAHPFPGIGLITGPLLTIVGFAIHGYDLIHMGFPPQLLEGLGAAIFFSSVIGILYKSWEENQRAIGSAPSNEAVPLTQTQNTPRLTDNQKHTLLGEAAKMRTLMRGILIAYTDSNPATETIARDLGDVFSRAGIAPWFGFARPDNPAHTSLILCVKDLNNPPPAAESVKKRPEVGEYPFCRARVSYVWVYGKHSNGWSRRESNDLGGTEPALRDAMIKIPSESAQPI